MIFTDEKLLFSHISELMMEQEIDFVVYSIASHWHAIGVDALVYSISQIINRKPSGVIVISPHPKDGCVISEGDFVCESFATVRFYFLDNRSQNQKSVVSRLMELFREWLNILLGIEAIGSKGKKYGTEVHIASILQPNIEFLKIFRNKRLASKYNPMFSVIDEGFGNYRSKKVTRWVQKLDKQEKGHKQFEAVRLVRTLVRTKVLEIPYYLLKIVAVKSVGNEYRFLFNKEQNKLIPNESIVSSYKSVIVKRGGAYEKIERTRPLAILVTQPFSEYRQISLISELDLIGTVIDILVQTGFDIVLKPHPRETIDKYAPILTKFQSEGVKLSHQKMPIEGLFPELDPACVIGYTSTALVTANTMYSIPAITIVGILISRTDTEYLRLAATEFRRLTEDICYNADTFAKLKDILSSIKIE